MSMNDYELHKELRQRQIRKKFVELLHDLFDNEKSVEQLPLPPMDDADVKKYIKETLGL